MEDSSGANFRTVAAEAVVAVTTNVAADKSLGRRDSKVDKFIC
jgi:hypothetical protein